VSFLVGGTLLILITTLFMNACSAKIGYDVMEPNHIVMNTVIASASAGCHIFMYAQYLNSFGGSERVNESQLTEQYNVHELCGGILAGLVSISGGGAHVELWAAAVIGFVGSYIYKSLRK
jgi:ammonia channel protein AmtB